LDATRTLVWTFIVVVIATSLGIYWLIRGLEVDNVVNKGAGVVEQPVISCNHPVSPGLTPVCSKDVKVLVDTTHQLITQTDVDGLYARAESSPGKAFDVQDVYIDTTNNQVDKVVYGTTVYKLEPTQTSFLGEGIVVLVVDVGAIGFLAYLLKRRRTPSQTFAGR
jgi:hypothetical protein